MCSKINLNKYIKSFLESNKSLLEKWESKENQSKLTKLFKDKTKPKAASSAYIFFCKEKKNRKKIVDNNPNLKPKQISKKMGETWKAMSDSKKQKYVDQYNEDKERYEEEMKKYVPKEGSYEELMTEKKQRKKSSLKKAKTGFQFFFEEMKGVAGKFEGMKAGEITTLVTEAWKQIKNTDEGKKFNEMAKKDKQRFDADKKEKDASKDAEGKGKKSKSSKKKEEKKEARSASEADDSDAESESESSGSESDDENSESEEEKEVVPVKQQKSGKRKSGSK